LSKIIFAQKTILEKFRGGNIFGNAIDIKGILFEKITILTKNLKFI